MVVFSIQQTEGKDHSAEISITIGEYFLKVCLGASLSVMPLQSTQSEGIFSTRGNGRPSNLSVNLLRFGLGCIWAHVYN